MIVVILAVKQCHEKNWSLGVSTRSDKNRAVQPQKKATGLNFQIKEVEDCTIYVAKKKGADQLCSYCAGDLCLYFCICKKQVFS